MIAELVLAERLDVVGVGVPVRGSPLDSGTQVGSCRTVLVSPMASTSAVCRLRALLETISHGLRPNPTSQRYT